MKTTIARYFLLGVTLITGVRAELLPNPTGDGNATSTANWYGMAVQDSGFLVGGSGQSGSAQSSDRATDNQGFASYYNNESENGNTNGAAGSTQLASSGAFGQSAAGAAGSGSGMLMAMGGVSDILAETVQVTSTFASSRPLASMSPSSGSASSMSPSSSGASVLSPYSSAWQLAPQASSYTQDPSPAANDTYYATQMIYGGSYGAQTNNYQPYTGYSYLNQYANNYAPTAPTGNTNVDANGNTIDDALFFALMNAGLSVTQTFYTPPSSTVNGSQALTTLAPITILPLTDLTGVPEPQTWLLLGSALAALAARRKYSRS